MLLSKCARDCTLPVDFSFPESSANKPDKEDGDCSKEDGTLLATSSTLVIGRNNSGKSTIVAAIDKLAGSDKAGFSATDFNYGYLEELLNNAYGGSYEQTPQIHFCFKINLDSDGKDILSNIADFVTPEMLKTKQDIIIEAIWKVKDEASYKTDLEAIIVDNEGHEGFGFTDYLAWLDEREFKLEYRDANERYVERFNLRNLIRFKLISANDITRENSLTDTFNRILKSRYKKQSKPSIDASIDKLNETLEADVCKKQEETINGILSDEVLGSRWKANLSADITFEKIVKSLLRYDYKEGEHIFPEGQFGMGHTRLMMIIAHIIEHLDTFEGNDEKSHISLIAIEEPENHMHPQMQEYFIQYISRVVDHLIEDGDLKSYGQLVITTHSDHIIHSKIQSGNTFNHINYIKEKSVHSEIVTLSDNEVMPSANEDKGEDPKALFAFLKKHMQLETNNIFFADGIMIVEGQSERLFLPPYIREVKALRPFFISIIGISGSHAHVYFNLLKRLDIPFVIITDIDFEKVDNDDVAQFDQIKDVRNRRTKNPTLKKVLEPNDGLLSGWDGKALIQNDGIAVFTQTECGGYYPSSFEEALILENYNNDLLNSALKSVKPRIYANIVQAGDVKGPEDREKNREHSHEWQIKLGGSKGAFITALMFDLVAMLENEDSSSPSKLLKMPRYIIEALDYLVEEVGGGKDVV